MRKIIAALQVSVDGFIEDPMENWTGQWWRMKRPGVIIHKRCPKSAGLFVV